jgi:RNA polymerase sigma-70 factor (ECF subfamily)
MNSPTRRFAVPAADSREIGGVAVLARRTATLVSEQTLDDSVVSKKRGAGGHGDAVRDRQAFERLFAEHVRDVLAYALRRSDPATAEDVAAEVFAIAWRRRDRIPEHEPVLWLYGVARRIIANEQRASRRRDALYAALSATRRDHVAEPPASTGPLLEALARLKPLDREALMLTAWEGLNGTQAALVLGCTRQALHTRVHRARARLAAELSRDEHTTGSPI